MSLVPTAGVARYQTRGIESTIFNLPFCAIKSWNCGNSLTESFGRPPCSLSIHQTCEGVRVRECAELGLPNRKVRSRCQDLQSMTSSKRSSTRVELRACAAVQDRRGHRIIGLLGRSPTPTFDRASLRPSLAALAPGTWRIHQLRHDRRSSFFALSGT